MAQVARKSQSNAWAVSGICRQKTGGRPGILGAVVRCVCSKVGHDERGALRASPISAQPRQEVAPC